VLVARLLLLALTTFPLLQQISIPVCEVCVELVEAGGKLDDGGALVGEEGEDCGVRTGRVCL
jgi:hypothetical protein